MNIYVPLKSKMMKSFCLCPTAGDRTAAAGTRRQRSAGVRPVRHLGRLGVHPGRLHMQTVLEGVQVPTEPRRPRQRQTSRQQALQVSSLWQSFQVALAAQWAPQEMRADGVVCPRTFTDVIANSQSPIRTIVTFINISQYTIRAVPHVVRTKW